MITCRTAITNSSRVAALGCVVWLTASSVAAQPPPAIPDIATMSMQDLLDVETVSSASKFPQAIREAPASITVITAEDIRRYGYRTLADTLRGVRGLYTSYDRNYSYLGMRGFARPGDYNTRILLLLDGQRLNDGIYDMAPIGTDFPIDLSLVARIEIIRGPGSSLYGTSAFFAVINVLTHSGATRKGLHLDTQVGSLETRGFAASLGRAFGNGGDFLVGGSAYRSPGQGNLYYPEFDNAGSSQGLAIDLDDDESSNVFGSLNSGHFSLNGGVAHRRKQIPTASYGTIFGDDRETTVDNRSFLHAVYDGPVGRGWSGTARLAYDYYTYRGDYPYDYGADGTGLAVDDSSVHTATGELTMRRRVARIHLFTAGVEIRDQIRNHQASSDIYGEFLDVDAAGTNSGVYVEDEVRIFPWLLGNVGFRVDHVPTFGSHATPRAALVFLPRPQTAVKLLYGRAFRAPNAYELYYFNPVVEGRAPLGREQIVSTEIVWEESLSKHVRTAVIAYAYDAEELITQQRGENDPLNQIYFANRGDVHVAGLEAEVEARLPNGIVARFSQTFAHARDMLDDLPVSNSPAHLSKLGVQIPVSSLVVSAEAQYVGERLTLTGAPLAGFFTANVTLTSAPERRFSFSLSAYNALNVGYADPGAEEHAQQSIGQDGRTVLARVHVKF